MVKLLDLPLLSATVDVGAVALGDGEEFGQNGRPSLIADNAHRVTTAPRGLSPSANYSKHSGNGGRSGRGTGRSRPVPARIGTTTELHRGAHVGGATATRADVARLFGRVAFGATAADLDRWTGRPYAEVVESLVSQTPDPLAFDEWRRLLSDLNRTFGGERESGDTSRLRAAQTFWLERMRGTTTPVVERMTLLWHGHFATALRNPYPDTSMLVGQNQTLRAHALGNFRNLVVAMNIDTAMLWWLDGTISSRPVPNENYARELFELFTLGKYPQVYSEADIREAARALTGWVSDGFGHNVGFDANRHDAGHKSVLGRTIANLGAREHEAVVDAALAQPVAARFIAYKMVRELAYDPGRADLLRRPDPLVVKVANVLQSTRWDLRSALRALLQADEFRYATPPHQGVRTPVEMVVHASKALGISTDDDIVLGALAGMGQRLFDPSNVGGWPFGQLWFSPVATLARYQFAVRAWELRSGNFLAPLPPAADLKAWTALFGLAGLTPNTERTLRAFLAAHPKATEQERAAGVVVLMLSSPDWAVW